MIEIALGKLNDLKSSLQTLAMNRGLSMSSAYNLSKIIKQTEIELEFYEKSRIELCKQYGTLPEGSDVFTFDEENRNKFNQKFVELYQIPIKFDFEKMEINKEDFINGLGKGISAMEIIALEEYFITINDKTESEKE